MTVEFDHWPQTGRLLSSPLLAPRPDCPICATQRSSNPLQLHSPQQRHGLQQPLTQFPPTRTQLEKQVPSKLPQPQRRCTTFLFCSPNIKSRSGPHPHPHPCPASQLNIKPTTSPPRHHKERPLFIAGGPSRPHSSVPLCIIFFVSILPWITS